MPKQKKRISRPNKLVVFDCVDKEKAENWSDDRPLISFPRPFRAVLTGPPGVGKSSVVKSILINQPTFFEQGWVFHPDPSVCEGGEYTDSGLMPLDEIPPAEWFYAQNPSKDHCLFVFDDVDLSSLSKDQHSRLDRLLCNASTHCNISVICVAQNFYSLPTVVRRTSNVFVLWKPVSSELDLKSISKRVGLNGKTLKTLFDTHCPSSYDSVWIDLTPNSPCKVRINAVKALKEIEN